VQLFTESEKIRAKTRWRIGAGNTVGADTQLLLFADCDAEGDLGLMLVTRTSSGNAWEKQLTLALGADVLSRRRRFLDDRAERVSATEEEKALYPVLPDWPVICFIR